MLVAYDNSCLAHLCILIQKKIAITRCVELILAYRISTQVSSHTHPSIHPTPNPHLQHHQHSRVLCLQVTLSIIRLSCFLMHQQNQHCYGYFRFKSNTKTNSFVALTNINTALSLHPSSPDSCHER